jgi:membrane carboxypeptidase/penicillin-binding protein
MFAIRARDAGVHMNIVNHSSLKRKTYFSNGLLDPPFIRYLLIKLNRDLDKISIHCPSYHSESIAEQPIHRMVLLLEDKRFFKHRGVDVWSLAREFFRMVTFQRYGGASTIDMQLVRTITGYKERTIRRKLYEMILARLIQYHATKWQILEAYLHEAYFGTGLTGVIAASGECYNKRPKQLTNDEAAFIASLLVYPRPRHENVQWKARITRRARYALELHARPKKISK